jgi:hypothetical protein
MDQRATFTRTLLIFFSMMICVAVLSFEIYVVAVQKEGDLPLPALFGNFPGVRGVLEKAPRKDHFSFAVIGDTVGLGTFEKISEQLRKLPLDFAVLLGDCAYKGTKFHHRYFRAECAEEYALPYPVFYVVGNHEVSVNHFPVSRFEETYGPSIFSFTYQDCLFVVLRTLDPPFNNADSIKFLKQLKDQNPEKYRRRFVFMHIPPPISDSFVARHYSEWKELVALFKELAIDTVFSGDFHGYARVQYDGVNYVVTGGGGSPLDDDKTNIKQFHHAVIVTVHPDHIAEQILYVPGHFELEDYLEKAALANVYPWMEQNRLAVIGANIFFLTVLVVSFRVLMALRTHRRKNS